ncbi:MAG: addiction module protein [Cyanothece sp. SIO2G6]|nr:addiction module protein [Cyanothece sp. SIO2G6]
MPDMTYDEMCGVVLTLSPLYRAMLADHLLNSIDDIDPDVEAAWNTEVGDRINAIEQGKVTLVEASEVFQQLRNR